jgi:hypothetical protein
VKIDPKSITVVDFLDNRDRIADLIAQGVQYEIGRVTPENLDGFLSARLSDGDMLLDGLTDARVWTDDRAVASIEFAVERVKKPTQPHVVLLIKELPDVPVP